MKKFISVFVLCLAVAGSGFSAGVDFDQLKNRLSDTYVKPLAKDIGSVLGGDMFHSGRPIGTFLYGIPRFEIGVGVAGSLKPSKDDAILREGFGSAANPKDQMFGLPFAQVSLGLPLGVDVTLRGAPEYQGLKLMGGGIKYCLYKKSFVVTSLGLSAMYSYNQLEYKSFKAVTNSVAGIFSVKIPVIEPYAGIAMDNTKLDTQFTPAQLATASNPLNISAKTSQVKYVVGINFSMIPFTYTNIAATSIGDHYGVDAGLGLKF